MLKNNLVFQGYRKRHLTNHRTCSNLFISESFIFYALHLPFPQPFVLILSGTVVTGHLVTPVIHKNCELIIWREAGSVCEESLGLCFILGSDILLRQTCFSNYLTITKFSDLIYS